MWKHWWEITKPIDANDKDKKITKSLCHEHQAREKATQGAKDQRRKLSNNLTKQAR